MNSRRLYLAVLCTLLLSACGYSLRGSDLRTDSLTLGTVGSLHLTLKNPNGEFARLLQRSLTGAGVDIVEPGSSAANSRLAVSEVRVENRPVSVNPAARAAQYELRLAVDIQLTNGGEDIIPLQTLSVERSYFEDIENIAGNQEEVEIITDEMRRELVNLLLRRLQSSATQA